MTLMQSRRVLTEKQLAAIGSVAVESSYLESLIEGLIGQLSGLRPEVLKVFSGNAAMMGGKIEILGKLGTLKLRSKKRKHEWAKIISELKEANTERAIAIHGIWERIEPTNELRHLLLGFAPTGEAQAIHKNAPILPAARIDKLATRINSAYDRLWAFYVDVWHAAWLRRFLREERKRSSG